MKKLLSIIIITATLCGVMTVGAYAVDYTFEPNNPYAFYGSTYYEDVYGSEYNYGGLNPSDFAVPDLPGIPEYYPLPTAGDSPSYSSYDVIEYSPASYDMGAPVNYYPDSWGNDAAAVPAYTSASELLRSDGSVGTLSIPSLAITMNAYPGTGNSSMNRGLGHFDEMSGWDGNVALCGHNRGALYTIGNVKNLSVGDTIQYATVYGTRNYAVSFVGYIAKNDWSYLGQTADNRITLITCLADQPELRVCVQAVET